MIRALYSAASGMNAQQMNVDNIANNLANANTTGYKMRSKRSPRFRRGVEMIRALYSAASGMNAQQMNVDNIANNLANANTTGYKMRRAQFQDLIYQTVVQPGSASGQQTLVPTGLQVGLGTRSSSNEI